MTRIWPSDEPSTSKMNGVAAMVTCMAKVFGVLAKRLERKAPTSTNSPKDVHDMEANQPSISTFQIPVYTQSSTRQLAFGNQSNEEDHKKPLDDFYNNATLTNVSKLFCAIVLIIAFILIMSRSLQFVAHEASNKPIE